MRNLRKKLRVGVGTLMLRGEKQRRNYGGA
jgi:hypothetical protein